MSGLGELLEGVRTYYLDRFRAAIEEHEAEEDQEVIAEAPLLDDAGERVREGALELPYRLDLAILRGGECVDSVTVDTEAMLSFDPVEFTWEGRLRVELAGFQWNMCPLALSPAPSAEQLAALVGWFERWFEENDEVDPPFLGCVHYLSEPEEQDGECRLALDLGSAPLAAFEELLDAGLRAGATVMRIGQREEPDSSRSAARPRRPRRGRGRNPRRP